MPTRTTSEDQDDAKSQYTAFRCPKDLLALARVKAKQDRRSLSNYVICLIAKDVEGMELPPATPKKKRD